MKKEINQEFLDKVRKQYAKDKNAIYLSVPMVKGDFDLNVQKTLDYVLEQLEKM